MDDPALVCRRKRVGDLTRDLPRVRERQAASSLGRDDVRDRLTVDELHRERAYTARVLEAVDLRNVRMIEGREHLRLAFETGEAIGVGCEKGRKDFYRDVPQQLRVAGFVDLAHATRPDGGQDFIDAQTGAWSEGHEMRLSLSQPEPLAVGASAGDLLAGRSCRLQTCVEAPSSVAEFAHPPGGATSCASGAGPQVPG